MTQHSSSTPTIDWRTTSNWQLSPDPWMDLFVDELRRRGADGAEIGDARAVVESHCRESQTSAQHSFGDPVAYARTIQPARSWADRLLLRQLVPTLLAIGGWWASLYLPLELTNRPVTVTWGSIAVALALTVMALAVGPLWRYQRREPGKGLAAMFALFFCHNMLEDPLRRITATAFTCPAWLLWAAGGVAMVLGTAGCLMAVHDRAVDPRTGSTPSTLPAFWWYALGAAPLYVPAITVLLRLAARS